MAKDFIRLIPATSVDSSTLSGTYTAINSSGLPFSCFMLRITNGSTKNVNISIDGTTLNEVVLSGASIELKGQQNHIPANEKASYSKGLVLYAAGTAGTGNVYLSGYYQI